MSKEIKNIALPINKIEYSKSNKNLIKCTIYVMHTGENLNYSSFSEESVLKAKESLKNVPILANIKHDEDRNPTDFGGHDMDLHIIERANGDCEFKTVYIEKPVGVIPETNNYRIETLENGEKWVVVEGYIWKEYSDSHELLTRTDKKVSMEISVGGGYFDDNFMYHIEDYEYLGVTILGDDCPPAMGENATISLFNKSEDFKVEYTKLLEEVKNFEEGGIEVEDNKELETVEVEETPVAEEQVEETVTDSVVEEVEPTVEEDFAKKKKCEDETDEDEVENPKKEEDGSEEDDDFAKKKKCEQEDFEAKYNEVVNELNELKAKYVDLEATYTALNDEVVELREFKSNIETKEYQAEVDAMLEKYSELEDVQGYSEIIKDKYSMEIDKLETAIKVFAFDNGVVLGKKTKKNFTKKDTTIVFEKEITETFDPYNGLLDKFIQK